MITNTEVAELADIETVEEVATGPWAPESESALASRRNGCAQRVYERGMVTAEWAIGVVVAVSLAGLLLIFIVKGPGRELLTGVILKIINAVSAWGLKG